MEEYLNENQVKRENINLRKIVREYVRKNYSDRSRKERRLIENNTIRNIRNMVREARKRGDIE